MLFDQSASDTALSLNQNTDPEAALVVVINLARVTWTTRSKLNLNVYDIIFLINEVERKLPLRASHSLNLSIDGHQIASSFEATRVYFNHDIPEVKELLSRLDIVKFMVIALFSQPVAA